MAGRGAAIPAAMPEGGVAGLGGAMPAGWVAGLGVAMPLAGGVGLPVRGGRVEPSGGLAVPTPDSRRR